MAKATSKTEVVVRGVRGGRIAPLCEKVWAALAGGNIKIAALAANLKATERDIRLAIDKLRADGLKVYRTEPCTYARTPDGKAVKVKAAKAATVPNVKATSAE